MDEDRRGLIPLRPLALATRQEGSLLARSVADAHELARAHRPRLIIINSNPRSYGSLGHRLAVLGYRVLGAAENGEEGVALFRDTRPDIVIMNGLPPRVDDRDPSRIILSEDPRVSILLMSSGLPPGDRSQPTPGEQERIQRARMAGISACLAEPYTIEDVMKKVDLLAAMPTHEPFEWFWVPPAELKSREEERWPADPDFPQYGRISEEPDEVPGFLIARLPVTNAQFHLFVKDGGYSNPAWWGEAQVAGVWNPDVGYLASPDPLPMDAVPLSRPHHPMVMVSVFQARAFALWLRAALLESDEMVAHGKEVVRLSNLLGEKGWKVDLPAESEWRSAFLTHQLADPEPDWPPAPFEPSAAPEEPCLDCGIVEWTRSVPPKWRYPELHGPASEVATGITVSAGVGFRALWERAKSGLEWFGFRLAIVPPGSPSPS